MTIAALLVADVAVRVGRRAGQIGRHAVVVAIRQVRLVRALPAGQAVAKEAAPVGVVLPLGAASLMEGRRGLSPKAPRAAGPLPWPRVVAPTPLVCRLWHHQEAPLAATRVARPVATQLQARAEQAERQVIKARPGPDADDAPDLALLARRVRRLLALLAIKPVVVAATLAGRPFAIDPAVLGPA